MLSSFRRRRHAIASDSSDSDSEEICSRESTVACRQHRALDIPEIVELILSHVMAVPFGFEGDSQPCENNTFRPQGLVPRIDQGHHARLVCRAWYSVVTELRKRMISSTSEDPTVPSLVGCKRLAYTFVPTRETQEQAISLVDQLQHAYNVQHVGRIRELLLTGVFSVSGELINILSLHRMTRNLTMLDLQFDSHQTLDIQLFFSPASSSSMTSPSPSVTFVLPNLKHFMLRQVELATLPEDWALSEPPLLKSFCLNHVRMNETTLDALLRNFCHKDLKRLVLLSLVNPGSPTIGTRDQHLVVTEERIMTIAVLSPHLQTIMTNQPSGEEALESLDRVRAAFPHATELAASHLTSVHDPVPAIFKVDQHLTRLEITLSTCWDRHEFPTPAFHAFLCSDKARHLKQLHAPMVKYDAEYLDPQRRTEWTCRGLELLALGFLPKESHDRFSAASSRSMFGFLATMCPRLRYLEIERAHLVASPESGLCFLSRLEELEELVLRTKYFYHWGDYDLTSRPIPPWWASREPTLLQQLKHQDSLGLCRTVSQRDAMGGHFGTLRGKGVLWKNHNHTTTAAITEAETTTTTTKSASTKLSSGACWHKLKKICIQLDEEIEKRNDERNQLRVRAIRKAIPQCQVSIEYVKVK